MWSLGFWLLDSDFIVQPELNCGDIKPLQTQNVSTLNPGLGNFKTKRAQNLRLHDPSCLLPLHQISPYIQIQKLEYCKRNLLLGDDIPRATTFKLVTHGCRT